MEEVSDIPSLRKGLILKLIIFREIFALCLLVGEGGLIKIHEIFASEFTELISEPEV